MFVLPAQEDEDHYRASRMARVASYRFNATLQHEALTRYLEGILESRTKTAVLEAVAIDMATKYTEGRYPLPQTVPCPPNTAWAWVQT